MLLKFARLHLLTTVGALLARVQLLLVLLQFPTRDGFVADRAQSDVARAVQRVHHVARGGDVPTAGEEGTIYEQAFCQEREDSFDVIESGDTFPRPRCGCRSRRATLELGVHPWQGLLSGQHSLTSKQAMKTYRGRSDPTVERQKAAVS